ncbi:MAG: response regulator [Bacteroidota bacterium]
MADMIGLYEKTNGYFMPEQIKILIADDVSTHLENIKNLVSKYLNSDQYTITEFEFWNQAEAEIINSEKSFDFVITDFKFGELHADYVKNNDQNRNANNGGLHIVIASHNRDIKTRNIIISNNFGTKELMNVTAHRLHRMGIIFYIIDKDIKSDDQLLPFVEELMPFIDNDEIGFEEALKDWSDFMCSNLDRDQRDLIKDKMSKISGWKEFETVLNGDTWKLGNLFPQLNHETDKDKIRETIYTALAKFPYIDNTKWSEKSDTYKLPLKDYYQKLLFESEGIIRKRKLEDNAFKVLDSCCRMFVYKKGDPDYKTQDPGFNNALNETKSLLQDFGLIGGFTSVIPLTPTATEKKMYAFKPDTMTVFCKNLAGRIIAIGMYILLKFTVRETYNLLMFGRLNTVKSIGKDGKEIDSQPLNLFSNQFFMAGGHTDNWPSRPESIIEYCSKDEREIFYKVISVFEDWLIKDPDLDYDDIRGALPLKSEDLKILAKKN